MEDYRESENFRNYNHRPEFMRLEYFEIYLSNIERLIEESRAELAEAIKKAQNEYADDFVDDIEAMERWGDDWMFEQGIWNRSIWSIDLTYEDVIQDDISNELFYPSFFISLYADFEKSLLKLCNELRSSNEKSVRDIDGTGIQRSQKYLVKVLNVNDKFFGRQQVGWSKIDNYRKIRNHLAHDDKELIYTKNGKFCSISEDDPNLLSLYKKRGINWIIINKEFCSDAINVIGNFWVSLFQELSKKFKLSS